MSIANSRREEMCWLDLTSELLSAILDLFNWRLNILHFCSLISSSNKIWMLSSIPQNNLALKCWYDIIQDASYLVYLESLHVYGPDAIRLINPSCNPNSTHVSQRRNIRSVISIECCSFTTLSQNARYTAVSIAVSDEMLDEAVWILTRLWFSISYALLWWKQTIVLSRCCHQWTWSCSIWQSQISSA